MLDNGGKKNPKPEKAKKAMMAKWQMPWGGLRQQVGRTSLPDGARLLPNFLTVTKDALQLEMSWGVKQME